MEKYKCKYCKDTGKVKVGRNAKELKNCPYCSAGKAKIITPTVTKEEAPKAPVKKKPTVPRGQRKMEVIYK